MDGNWAEWGIFMATAALALMTAVMTGINYSLLRSNTDPHVIVYAADDDNRPTILTLVVKNIGARPAYDVTFTSSEPIPARGFGFEPSPTPLEPQDSGPLVHGISMLAPGESRMVNWGQYHGLHGHLQDRAVEVTAHFVKHVSPRRRKKLEVRSYLDVYSFAATDASRQPHVQVAKQVKRVADSLHSLQRDVASAIRVAPSQADIEATREWVRQSAEAERHGGDHASEQASSG